MQKNVLMERLQSGGPGPFLLFHTLPLECTSLGFLLGRSLRVMNSECRGCSMHAVKCFTLLAGAQDSKPLDVVQ